MQPDIGGPRISPSDLAAVLLAQARAEAATQRANAVLLEVKLRYRLAPEDEIKGDGRIVRKGSSRRGLEVVKIAPGDAVKSDGPDAPEPAPGTAPTIPPPPPAPDASDDGCQDG